MVEVKQDAAADHALIFNALECEAEHFAGRNQHLVLGDEFRRAFERGERRRTRKAHHLRIGSDRKDRGGIVRAQRSQQQAAGA